MSCMVDGQSLSVPTAKRNTLATYSMSKQNTNAMDVTNYSGLHILKIDRQLYPFSSLFCLDIDDVYLHPLNRLKNVPFACIIVKSFT